ncbi:MAG TPA: ImmA/IrrE family metallo-endopeptidase [Pirellulales bacterium]|nr:ImmA/IrrE family metallo-endopeptidase [Pirellulales bacterium]
MKDLYGRLGSIGLPRKYVKTVALPSWWDDEAASNPSGYAEGALFIARHLGLEYESLVDSNAKIRVYKPKECKFKKREGTTDEDLLLSQSISVRAAHLAASAMSKEYKELPPSAGEVRQEILSRGARCVNLQALVDYCWSIGIPVLHVSRFPASARKMDGLAACVEGRPVIVISRREHHSAWLLFILAHELGHIAHRHVCDDAVILDERIDEKSSDSEEKEANAFAIQLLTGDQDCQFRATGRWPNAEDLAQSAMDLSRKHGIDAGHIALNYGHTMGKFFPVARAALKIIEPKPEAIRLIGKYVAKNLDWSMLPSESCEFLMRVTQPNSDDNVPAG